LMIGNHFQSHSEIDLHNVTISTDNLHILNNYNNSVLVNSGEEENKPILYIGKQLISELNQ
jgi:hypothetical protein